MSLVALSEMLGASVRDASGAVRGRVREIAVTPQEHPTRIAFLIVRTPDGERMLPVGDLKAAGSRVRAESDASTWERYAASDGVSQAFEKHAEYISRETLATQLEPGLSDQDGAADWHRAEDEIDGLPVVVAVQREPRA